MTDEQNLIAQFGRAFDKLEEMGFEILKPLSPEAVAALTEKLLADPVIAAEAERTARSFGPITNLHDLIYQRLDESQRNSANILTPTLAVLRPFLAEPLVREFDHKAPQQTVGDDRSFRQFGLEGLPEPIKADVLPDISSNPAIIEEAKKASLPPGERTELCLLICKHCEAKNHPVRLIDVGNIAIALVRQFTNQRVTALQDLRSDPSIVEEAKRAARTDGSIKVLAGLIREKCGERNAFTSDEMEMLAKILVENFTEMQGVIVLVPPERAF